MAIGKQNGKCVRYQIDIIDPAQGDPSKVLSQYDFEHAVIRAVKPY